MKIENWTPAYIDKQIKKLDKKENKGSTSWQAYRVLLTAAVVGANAKKILAFWPKEERKGMPALIQRARKQKIFYPNGKLDGEIYEDGLGLVLGATVLMGFIERRLSKAA